MMRERVRKVQVFAREQQPFDSLIWNVSGVLLRYDAVEMTAVGFEPTPLRTGALSQRLGTLGQTVLSIEFKGSTGIKVVPTDVLPAGVTLLDPPIYQEPDEEVLGSPRGDRIAPSSFDAVDLEQPLSARHYCDLAAQASEAGA
jgi:hypothetical protein